MSATRRPFGLVLAAGVLAATPARPQSARHPRVTEAIFLIETWLDAQRAYQRIPGLSAAVVRDQELVWSGGFGLADRSPDIGNLDEQQESNRAFRRRFGARPA